MKTLLIFLATFCISSSIWAQTVVTLTPTTAIEICDNMVPITVGEQVEFVLGSNCNYSVAIYQGDDELVVFNSGDMVYTFTELGEYTIRCNGAVIGTNTLSACVSVSAVEPIPTLSQWSIILLLISLTIFGLVGVRSRAFQIA